MPVANTTQSSVTNHSNHENKMSDFERSWNDDSIALPPTPGKTLNILPKQKKSGGGQSAKRRLELGSDSSKKVKEILDPLQKKLKPFTIPKKTNPKPPPIKKDDRLINPPSKAIASQPNPKKVKHEQEPKKFTPSEHSTHFIPKKIKQESDDQKLSPTEDKTTSRRLKTQAWANILKHKKKLYIPHTSDPRTTDELSPSLLDDPLTMDKENSCLNLNVITTDIIQKTPLKVHDHNSIIKFMSLTPQLLSPLSEHPKIFK